MGREEKAIVNIIFLSILFVVLFICVFMFEFEIGKFALVFITIFFAHSNTFVSYVFV
jgi:hypothetical protein